MIELFLDVISMLIFMVIVIWAILIVAKNYCKNNNKRKALKGIEEMEKIFKRICENALILFFMFINIMIAAILGIAIKPIVYKLNQPLGWGYATFASYFIAICLYILLPKLFQSNEEKTK